MKPSSPLNLLKTMDYSVLQQCMHCGMCLPTCPTYDETRRERNSPRGRIALMRDIADDALPVDREFAEEMYYCLGCLACQSACPAGVDYAKLFEVARAEVTQQKLIDSPSWRFYRWLTLRCLFMRPRLLRFVGRLLWLYQSSGMQLAARKTRLTRLLPKNLYRLEPRAPQVSLPFSDSRIAEIETPSVPRYRVGLLTGCIQDIVYADVNRATTDVLLKNGCEIVTPRNQFCCGSLHAHNGDLEGARILARRNLDMFQVEKLDAIITNAGGCGSHLKTYAELLSGEVDYETRAIEWDQKVKDIHEWLIQISYYVPRCEVKTIKTIVTYDDSCHLCHGQKVASQPRKILASLPNVVLVDLPEADWCCGSAGIYSITQPEQAEKLLERKLDHLQSTGATVLATANPGCQLQLTYGIKHRSELAKVRVIHPVRLLAEAYAQDYGQSPH
jgi:glycolate oxidase iron-sulfur subunit